MIFRGLVTAMESSLRRISVAVQLPPPAEDADIGAQKYLTEYFEDIHVRVYWARPRNSWSSCGTDGRNSANDCGGYRR